MRDFFKNAERLSFFIRDYPSSVCFADSFSSMRSLFLYIRFHSYGKNEEEEAFAFHRNDFYRRKGAVDYHFNFIAAGCAKSFEKIAVIEAHIYGFAFDVAFDNVAYLTESGGTGDFDFSVSDGKADRALESVVDKKAGSVDGIKEISYFNFNNCVCIIRNRGTEIDEIALEKS